MVYIIVLNWNGWKDTVACLESLMDLNYSDFKIIICDNDSTDGSAVQIQEWYLENNAKFSYLVDADYQHLVKTEMQSFYSTKNKGVYLIQTGDNLGYAGGNNIGIQFALNQGDVDYVWVLNNDTEVDSNALSEMVNACDVDPKIGVCGSKMVYFDEREKLQGLGGVYNPYSGVSTHYAEGEASSSKFNDLEVSSNIDYVIGASMLLTKELITELQGLPEQYFLYFEELDTCTTAQQKGYKLWVASESIVYHKEGASTESGKSLTADYYSSRSRLIYSWKFNKRYIIIVWFRLVATCLKRLINMEFKKVVNLLSVLLMLNIKLF
jgi:GT2 family glycosyltransferase